MISIKAPEESTSPEGSAVICQGASPNCRGAHACRSSPALVERVDVPDSDVAAVYFEQLMIALLLRLDSLAEGASAI